MYENWRESKKESSETSNSDSDKFEDTEPIYEKVKPVVLQKSQLDDTIKNIESNKLKNSDSGNETKDVSTDKNTINSSKKTVSNLIKGAISKLSSKNEKYDNLEKDKNLKIIEKIDYQNITDPFASKSKILDSPTKLNASDKITENKLDSESFKVKKLVDSIEIKFGETDESIESIKLQLSETLNDCSKRISFNEQKELINDISLKLKVKPETVNKYIWNRYTPSQSLQFYEKYNILLSAEKFTSTPLSSHSKTFRILKQELKESPIILNKIIENINDETLYFDIDTEITYENSQKPESNNNISSADITNIQTNFITQTQPTNINMATPSFNGTIQNVDLSSGFLATTFAANEVSEYDGNNMSLVEFVRECQNALINIPANFEKSLVCKLKNKLKGDIKKLMSYKDFNTVEEFLNCITNNYAKQFTLKELMNKLEATTQEKNEKVFSFVNRIDKMNNEIISVYKSKHEGILHDNFKEDLEALKLKTFRTGLRKDIHLELTQKGNNFNEAVQLAIETEELKQEREEIEIKQNKEQLLENILSKICKYCGNFGHLEDDCKIKNKENFCTFCKKQGHSITTCRSKNSKNNYTNFKNSNFNSQNSNKNLTCERCKKYGHAAINCRTICQNCNKIGHTTFNCRIQKQNVIQCQNCNKIGHTTFNCRLQKQNIQCLNCNKFGHTSTNCFQSKKNYVRKIDSSLPRVSNEDININCQICKKSGHLAANCKYRFINPTESRQSGNGESSPTTSVVRA